MYIIAYIETIELPLTIGETGKCFYQIAQSKFRSVQCRPVTAKAPSRDSHSARAPSYPGFRSPRTVLTGLTKSWSVAHNGHNVRAQWAIH